MHEDETPEREVVTAQDLIDAVSESVSRNVTDSLSERLDGLDARLDGVAGRVDGLSEAVAQGVTKDELASLSVELETATLQAGEIGPVLTEEIGPVIIDLMGALLEAWDSDGDGASDLASVVTEIQEVVQDISASVVHPAMSTPFTSYTVGEALLLMLVLFEFVKLWIGILRRGFRWMR